MDDRELKLVIPCCDKCGQLLALDWGNGPYVYDDRVICVLLVCDNLDCGYDQKRLFVILVASQE